MSKDGVLDAELFLEEQDLVLGLLKLGPQSGLGAAAIGYSAAGLGDRNMGERDDVDDRRPDLSRPIPR